ncbi:hypothetical protein Rhopal_007098-T1 [Rhodotorula paludigena]|uniref:TEA domain-containing protein n=1 Tax=Rhodotorula paludigena TaxID=86838 RepID=A0AAV5GX27_9BASI|nr:hypothetical protein Rhopal_007098-T1 [Rhodotorula paludigena]
MSRSSSRLAYKATEHQLAHPDDTASPAPSASATPARKSRTTTAAAATPSTPAATLAQPDDDDEDDDEDDAAAAPALAAIAAASGSSSSARPRNTPISASGRRLHNRAEEGNLWDAEMDRVLFAGMALIPALGRRTVWLGDDSYGRNGLLGEYLRRQTGKIRNRTQVASHLAVMRKNRPNDQQLADLINGHPLAADALATTNWSELLGPDLHPTSVSTAKAENDRVKRHRDEVVALQKARRGSSASLSNAGSPAAAHVSRSYVSSPGLGPGGASAAGSSHKGRKRGAAGTKRRAGRSSAAARDDADDDLASSDLSELPSSDDEENGAAAAGASASYKKARVSSRPPASLSGDGFDLAPAGPGGSASARQHSRRTSARRSYVPYGALATDGSDDDAHANEDDDDLTLSPARTRRVPPARGSTTPGSGFAPPKQPASLPGAGAGASAPPAPMFAAPAPGPFGSPSSTSAAGAAPADITSASIPAASTASASSSSFAAPPPPKSASAAMDLDDEQHADADESKPVVVVGVPAPSARAAPATSTLDELSRVAAAAAAAAVDEPAQADSSKMDVALLEEGEREALEAARARAREAGFGEVEAGELGEEGELGEGGERGFFGSVRKGLWKLVGL